MLRQIIAVTLLNIGSIPRRLGPSLVIVIGIAGVVGVLISVLAMEQGFLDTMTHGGRRDRAIVLRGGSTAELASTMSRDAALTITDAPGIRHDAADRPIASAEAVVVVQLPLRATGTDANVTLRGVGRLAGELRPEIHLLAGRMFQPAVRELVVGRNAVGQFAGLQLGSHIAFRDSDWMVVGIFESGGDSHESEMIADVDTVLSAYRRSLYQAVTVLLDNAQAFDGFAAFVRSNPQLAVEAKRETDYYAQLSEQLAKVMSFVAYVVGGIMAVGALFGALNTMYSAVSDRSIEIATLRALGFGATAVLVSVFVEALLLSVAGAAIGALLAWALFNGNAVNTLSGNFTQVVFHLNVTLSLAALGIIWAIVIGLVGGLFPALRAARLPVAEALRAV